MLGGKKSKHAGGVIEDKPLSLKFTCACLSCFLSVFLQNKNFLKKKKKTIFEAQTEIQAGVLLTLLLYM